MGLNKVKFQLFVFLCAFMVSGSALGEEGAESGDSASASAAQTKAEQEDAGKPPEPPKFKASFNKAFYEFQGVRGASQTTGGVPNYSFDRVTYDMNALALSYLYSPSLNFTLSNSYNEIYAETKFFGELFKDRTEGFSDTTLKGTKTWARPEGVYVFELGTIFPTGATDIKNENLPGAGVNYPYNMQLGSGTQDLLATGTFLKFLGKHQLGAFGMATVRLGRNDQGYRRGNEYVAKAWYSYQYNPYFSPGLWVNYLNIQGIEGRDRTLDNPAIDQLLRFYYNPRSFWDITANVNAQYPINKNLSIKGMLGSPLAQHSRNVDDIQLYTQWIAQAGVEGSF